jgi:tryptophanyl-tRNA synthetase
MFNEYFAPMKKRREELESDLGYVNSVLKNGAEKASAVAKQTMKEIRETIGF